LFRMDDKGIVMNLIESRDYFRSTLKNTYDTPAIDYYFKVLIQAFFKWEATIIGLQPRKILTKTELDQLMDAAKRLLASEPLQYITGSAHFCNLEFKVNPAVLIPRPETEELVEWIRETQLQTSKMTLLEVGTGSGCIAVSLGVYFPNAEIHALDIDTAAIEIAVTNADRHSAAINFHSCDFLTLSDWEFPLDRIVSNPPYISPEEKQEMQPNVMDYEPHRALFVPADNPLLFYRKILDFAQQHLKTEGELFFEINPKFLEAMRSLILSYKNYNIYERNDIFGKTRMMRLIKTV